MISEPEYSNGQGESWASMHYDNEELQKLVAICDTMFEGDSDKTASFLKWCELIAASYEIIDEVLKGNVIPTDIDKDGTPRFTNNPGQSRIELN